MAPSQCSASATLTAAQLGSLSASGALYALYRHQSGQDVKIAIPSPA